MITTPFEFENYIGKNVYDIGVEVWSRQIKELVFYKVVNSKFDFFGNDIENIFFHINETETIKEIDLYLSNINNNLYEGLTGRYGEPTRKLKEDQLLKSEYLPTNPNNYSKEYSTREIEGNEKPSIVIWEKEDFQILLFFNRIQNTTKINFTSKIY